MADFNTLSVTIPPPFYLSVPLLKYWDGQPVIYVCRKRNKDPVSKEGMLWSVAFEIVDEDAKKKLEDRDGKAVGRTDAKSPDGLADVADRKGHEDLSDDVD